MGKLANGMKKCCRIKRKKKRGGHRAEAHRSPTSVRVVPAQPEQERQRSKIINEIAALKWQKNIRQTLMIKNKPPGTQQHRMKRNTTWRTQRAEEIQSTHQNHRNLALKNIERQHSQKRSSLQARVQARNKKKEDEMNNGVPLGENGKVDAPVTGQALTKDDGGGGSAVNDTLEEVATPTTTSATNATVVENIRLIFLKFMKTPSRLQKFMARCDKTSSGFMARVDFTKVVRKVVKKNGQQEAKESLTEVVWASVKEGSGKEVARDVVEHEVVKRWLFFGVEDQGGRGEE